MSSAESPSMRAKDVELMRLDTSIVSTANLLMDIEAANLGLITWKNANSKLMIHTIARDVGFSSLGINNASPGI